MLPMTADYRIAAPHWEFCPMPAMAEERTQRQHFHFARCRLCGWSTTARACEASAIVHFQPRVGAVGVGHIDAPSMHPMKPLRRLGCERRKSAALIQAIGLPLDRLLLLVLGVPGTLRVGEVLPQRTYRRLEICICRRKIPANRRQRLTSATAVLLRTCDVLLCFWVSDLPSGISERRFQGLQPDLRLAERNGHLRYSDVDLCPRNAVGRFSCLIIQSGLHLCRQPGIGRGQFGHALKMRGRIPHVVPHPGGDVLDGILRLGHDVFRRLGRGSLAGPRGQLLHVPRIDRQAGSPQNQIKAVPSC